MRSDPMPFNIHDVELKQDGLTHRAVVITPKRPMVLGRERIERLRGPTSLNDVDRWLIEQTARREGRNRVILFRAKNERGERVWQFDPELSDAELADAGYLLSYALVPFHRRLLNKGVVLMVHTDWGVRECYAMRSGVRRLERELSDGGPGAEAPLREIDRWLLNNMLLHVALSLEHVTERLLPHHLTMIDRRWHQLQPLLAELPRHAVD